MFPIMRRKSREITRNEAFSILEDAEYGILSTTDNQAQPFGTPLSFIVNNETIYFHCSVKGAKTERLNENKKVCFTVVGSTEPVFENGSFSTYYESVMAFGDAYELRDDTQKAEILTLLCMKYLPDFKDAIAAEIQNEKLTTAVWAIPITYISGKSKRKI